jgi:hypothetical protein
VIPSNARCCTPTGADPLRIKSPDGVCPKHRPPEAVRDTKNNKTVKYFITTSIGKQVARILTGELFVLTPGEPQYVVFMQAGKSGTSAVDIVFSLSHVEVDDADQIEFF